MRAPAFGIPNSGRTPRTRSHEELRLAKDKASHGLYLGPIGHLQLHRAPAVQNRFYDGESLGAVIHFNDHNSIWIQETFNKIVTVPWYTTTSIGYTRSW